MKLGCTTFYACAAVVACAASVRGQNCSLAWSRAFESNGIGAATASCAAVFDDDGPGPHPPALYVGGSFTVAENHRSAYVAKWDGTRFQPMPDGPGGEVLSMVVYDEDGEGPGLPALYVGGAAPVSGNGSVVWRWDGSAWAPIGHVANDPLASITALCVHALGPGPIPELFAAGTNVAGGNRSVGRWDGSSWQSVGSLVGSASALIEFDSDGSGPGAPLLVAAGTQLNGAGLPSSVVYTWDGGTWSALPGTQALYVGGRVGLAAYDSDGRGPQPPALIVSGPIRVTGASGTFLDGIARWNGSGWSRLALGPGGAPQGVLATFDADGDGPGNPVLLLASQQPQGGRIMSWDGSSWSQFGADFQAPLALLAPYDLDGDGPSPPSLVGSGEFDRVAGQSAHRIAAWTAGVWSALGGGVSGPSSGEVTALTVHDDDGAGPHPMSVFVGGTNLSDAGDQLIPYLARWDGSSWSSVGAPSSIYALGVFDPDGTGPAPARLIAAMGMPRCVWSWDGSTWAQLGGGLDVPPRGFATFDPDGSGPTPARLIAVGDFTSSSPPNPPVLLNRIAQWDGSVWAPLGDGILGSAVNAAASFDDDGAGPHAPALYAGGQFRAYP